MNNVMKVTLVHQLKVLLTIVVMILSLRYYIKTIFLKEKGKKIIAGKWNQDGFDRLNELLAKIEEKEIVQQGKRLKKSYNKIIYYKLM